MERLSPEPPLERLRGLDLTEREVCCQGSAISTWGGARSSRGCVGGRRCRSILSLASSMLCMSREKLPSSSLSVLPPCRRSRRSSEMSDAASGGATSQLRSAPLTNPSASSSLSAAYAPAPSSLICIAGWMRMASAAVAIMDARSSAASSIIMWCVRRELELGEEAVVHLDDSQVCADEDD